MNKAHQLYASMPLITAITFPSIAFAKSIAANFDTKTKTLFVQFVKVDNSPTYKNVEIIFDLARGTFDLVEPLEEILDDDIINIDYVISLGTGQFHEDKFISFANVPILITTRR
jgi:hypothetical protein